MAAVRTSDMGETVAPLYVESWDFIW